MCKKQKLIIIGNGFDRFHGIPSSYYNFKEYLDNNISGFTEVMEYYINPEDLWSDFERALGELDTTALKEDCKKELIDYAFDDITEKKYCSYDYFIERSLKFASEIPQLLYQWINSIKLENIKKLFPQKILCKNALYFTFNYTHTLERIYQIPDQQILHVHGKVGEKDRPLIVGHGNKESIIKKPIYDEKVDYEIMRGEEFIADYWNDTYKDVASIIKEHSAFWNRLSNIDEVLIIGHSLADVDIPYFIKIREMIKNPDCIWWVTYYENKDKDRFKNILQNYISINKDHIRTVKIEDLHRKKCICKK